MENKYDKCIDRIAKNCKTTSWIYSDWDMEDDLETLMVLVDNYKALVKELEKAYSTDDEPNLDKCLKIIEE